jgi:hypothetical protein
MSETKKNCLFSIYSRTTFHRILFSFYSPFPTFFFFTFYSLRLARPFFHTNSITFFSFGFRFSQLQPCQKMKGFIITTAALGLFVGSNALPTNGHQMRSVLDTRSLDSRGTTASLLQLGAVNKRNEAVAEQNKAEGNGMEAAAEKEKAAAGEAAAGEGEAAAGEGEVEEGKGSTSTLIHTRRLLFTNDP